MNAALMIDRFTGLAAASLSDALVLGGIVFAVILALLVCVVVANYGALWFQAYMSGADITLLSLIGMTFRRVKSRMIVTAKIMARQAGLDISRHAVSTEQLEAHFLAGGDVMHVIRAIIAAQRADIDLDFDRASAIDLAGRDVLDAVQTSVSPKVIDCPDPHGTGNTTLSAVAKNGVELLIRARVTVRTNLDQLIGGATENTIIARVGQGIISAVGSSPSHMDVLEMPNRISKSVVQRGLDSNTAFEIVSIDITDIDVGENIGARLQTDQANADTRMARATAEVRRAKAAAWWQQMKAKVAENRAILVLAEAEIPAGLAAAFRAGRLRARQEQTARFRMINDQDEPDASVA